MQNYEKEAASFLTHYGVKGMKWGVRRDLKRQANANANAYYSSLSSSEAYVVQPITEREYQSLPSKPVKLGKDFSRIAAYGTTDFRDIAFVSKSEDDRIRYNALIGGANTMGRSRKKFDLKVKTATEAISPSMKTRVDTYIETLGQDIPTKNGKKTLKGRDFVHGSSHPIAKAMNDRELGFATYKIWAQGQHANDPLHSAYFNNLRKKGYNAVVDDADRGIVSDLPVILFPKESGARVTEVKPLTKDDILDAKLKVKRVTNPANV